MKKTVLFSLLSLLAITVLSVSCKKSKSSPSRSRLASYTEVTATNGLNAITNTYNFSYDGNNKVQKVTFSTNNPSTGVSGYTRTFSYMGDRVIINITFDKTLPALADTLILNPGGYIQTIIDSAGNVTYGYNSRSQATSAYDTNKHPLGAFTWNAQGDVNNFGLFDGAAGTYTYDTTKLYSTGDYVQLHYITLYGTTFMQSRHLTSQVTPAGEPPINILYTTDGAHRIVLISATQTFPSGDVYTEKYNLQYENY